MTIPLQPMGGAVDHGSGDGHPHPTNGMGHHYLPMNHSQIFPTECHINIDLIKNSQDVLGGLNPVFLFTE